MNRIHAHMAEARRLGVKWSDVKAIADEIRDSRLELNNDAISRRLAELLGIRGAWRTGLKRLATQLRNSGRDTSAIHYYDEVADQLRAEFPELVDIDSETILTQALEADEAEEDYFAEALGFCESHAQLLAVEECPNVGGW